MIILKVTKNQGFTLCLEDTIFKKPQEGEGVKMTPPRFRVKQAIGNNIEGCETYSDKLHHPALHVREVVSRDVL